MPRETLKFYCLKTKKSFTTDNYGVFKKNNRFFAITENKGNKCVRIVNEDFFKKHKR